MAGVWHPVFMKGSHSHVVTVTVTIHSQVMTARHLSCLVDSILIQVASSVWGIRFRDPDLSSRVEPYTWENHKRGSSVEDWRLLGWVVKQRRRPVAMTQLSHTVYVVTKSDLLSTDLKCRLLFSSAKPHISEIWIKPYWPHETVETQPKPIHLLPHHYIFCVLFCFWTIFNFLWDCYTSTIPHKSGYGLIMLLWAVRLIHSHPMELLLSSVTWVSTFN